MNRGAEAWDLIRQLSELHLPTLLLGVACLVALFLLERVIPRIPAALVVVVGAILAVQLLDLVDSGVLVAGEIPSGLPSFQIPTVDWAVVVSLIPGAIGVAIVVYGESMALSKTFSARHRERVDANQELIALGGANFAGGLFGAFVTNASNSRSAAADGAGQSTQVSSLVVVTLVVLTLLFLTSLFADLPEAALGAIVIHAVVGLIRLGPIAALRRRNRVDFWAAAATLAGVLVLDVLAGLMIGVLVSLAGLMARATRPRITWLGRDLTSGEFRDRVLPGVTEVEGLAIAYFGDELFFANVGSLRAAVVDEIDRAPARVVLLDAEAVTSVDTTAADELMKLANELGDRDVSLAFARLQKPAREALEAAGFELEGIHFGRVADAVDVLSS